MFRKSHCAVPLAPTTITNASKYISFTSAYIAYRDLELHRSSAAASNSILVNGGATTTTMSSTNNNSELDSSKMREKLAALEDLNELLEEPVEEQVSLLLILVLVFKSTRPIYGSSRRLIAPSLKIVGMTFSIAKWLISHFVL